MKRWITFDCFGTLIDWHAGYRAILTPIARERTDKSIAAYSRFERELEDRTNPDLATEQQRTRSPGTAMEDFAMIPGSLNARHSDLLSSPPTAQRDAVSCSTGRPAVLLAAMRRVLHTLSIWHARSRSRRALAGLDDHSLHDIGLTRADAEWELRKPFWRG